MVLLNGFEPSTSPLPKVGSYKNDFKSSNNSERWIIFFLPLSSGCQMVAKFYKPVFLWKIIKRLQVTEWCCWEGLNFRPLPSSRMRLSPLAIRSDCPLTFANRVCFRLPPSSLYTFSLRSLARDCHSLSTLGFPEFDGCTSEVFTSERQKNNLKDCNSSTKGVLYHWATTALFSKSFIHILCQIAKRSFYLVWMHI